MKAFLSDAAATFFDVVGLSNLDRFPTNRLMVLTFHRVLPSELREQYPLPGLAVTPEELRWVIVSLQPFFEVLTVTEACRQLEYGGGHRPLLAISFDDGQWDNLRYGAPVLQELGVKATYYLPTAYMETDKLLWHDRAGFAWMYSKLGTKKKHELIASLAGQTYSDAIASVQAPEFVQSLKELEPAQRLDIVDALEAEADVGYMEWARMMTWGEAAGLLEAGHEIGSHGCTHGLLPQQTANEQKLELQQSKQTIERKLGIEVQSFCYPNGDYDEATLTLMAECGYSNAVTTQWGANKPDYAKFELRRCDINPFSLLDRRGMLSKSRLQMRLSGLHPGLR